jgi:beta-N-acetylhexosaminidase
MTLIRAVGAVVTIALLWGCAAPTASPGSSPPASPTPVVTSLPTPTAQATPVPSPSPSPTAEPSCAERTLAGMTTSERTGQLFLMGLEDDRLGPKELAAIRDQHVGSVWFTTRTTAGVAGVRRIADAVQAEASEAATARVGFFVAANQEGGRIQALTGPGFAVIPSAVDQGKIAPATLEKNALTWGREMAAAGVNLDFAPVFDVVPPGADARNQPIGVLRREYGHDPETAGTHAAAFVRGMTAAGVATTAKHFPGLGRVVGNTDDTADVVDDATTATDPYLDSFRMGVAANVPFVMVALATYTQIDPDHLAAFSSVVLGRLLRDDLGFTGVVMSDDLGETAAVAAIPAGRRAVDFLLAGGDFVVSKTADATGAMVEAVAGRAAADPAFASRVDDATLRVLEAKEAAGLLDCSG